SDAGIRTIMSRCEQPASAARTSSSSRSSAVAVATLQQPSSSAGATGVEAVSYPAPPGTALAAEQHPSTQISSTQQPAPTKWKTFEAATAVSTRSPSSLLPADDLSTRGASRQRSST